MRYSTPLWVRPTGYYNADGNYVRTGSRDEVGVPLPMPGSTPPKHGHWRITPGGKHKMAPRKSGGVPMWPAQQPRAFAPATYDDPAAPSASVRQRVRMAVAAGIIAPADAPAWAQPQ